MPISRLPTEIFTNVFTYCMDPEPWNRPDFMLRLTHVCRQWRAVILNCPLFWSCPDFSRPELAKAMIQRSRSGPLDVRLDRMKLKSGERLVASPNVLSAVTEALAETSRIRTLDLSVITNSMPSDIWQRLVSSLTYPMPSLQSLNIRTWSLGGSLYIPVDFLGGHSGHSPSLKELSLLGCQAPWGSPVLASLTTLNLYGNRVLDLPSTSQFLQALAGMPLLEVLLLTDVFPVAIIPTDTPSHIALPCLRRLHLEAMYPPQAPSCLETLCRLSFPRGVKTWLHISYDESAFLSSLPDSSTEFSSSELIHSFFRKASSLGEAKALRLYSESDDILLEMEVWFDVVPFDPKRDPFDSTKYPFRARASFGADIEWHGASDTPIANIMHEMTRTVSLQHLDTLDIRQLDEGKESVNIILNVLVDSMTLRCLLVGRANIRSFIGSITAAKNADEGMSRTDKSLAFPALRDLGFYNINFRPLIRQSLLWPLITTLEMRPEKLERLILMNATNLPHPELQRLQNTASIILSYKMELFDLHVDTDESQSSEDDEEESQGHYSSEDDSEGPHSDLDDDFDPADVEDWPYWD
ncbi:hypothetical protein VNI00_018187 [Paramarasmius palmivorus]|uniref:F-box domain-containing protein n=1 Tax=Paramarasmius palmivorus TaxID=297713 RepID=A0AAW0B278_9AGAR